MKPKFSWDSATAGSLTLRITEGEKETTWRVRKNTSTATLVDAFHSIANALESAEYFSPRRSEGFVGDIEFFNDDSSVDWAEDEDSRVAQSMASLADKANSFKLDGGNFWGSSDMDELDLYVLGTGDPE